MSAGPQRSCGKTRRPNRPGCTFRPPQAPPLPRKSSEGTTGHSPGARPPLSLSPRGRLLLEPRHRVCLLPPGQGAGGGGRGTAGPAGAVRSPLSPSYRGPAGPARGVRTAVRGGGLSPRCRARTEKGVAEAHTPRDQVNDAGTRLSPFWILIGLRVKNWRPLSFDFTFIFQINLVAVGLAHACTRPGATCPSARVTATPQCDSEPLVTSRPSHMG